MSLNPASLFGRTGRLIIVGSTVLLLAAVKLAGGFDGVNRNAFDLMSTIAPPRPQQPAAVIVAIDEPSFSALGKSWPWPRDIHAHLIQSLRQAGARKIAFDVVFAEPTNAASDEALAAAADAETILAADETLADTAQGTMLVRTEPLPLLSERGARVGMTSIAVDPDGVVRRIPRYPDSLAQRFLSRPELGLKYDRLIQYFGGARTYPYVSYYQALNPTHFLPAGFFNNRDVIVGLAVQASPEIHQVDSFETAFTKRTGQLVPGVEIHATILDNLRHHLWIAPTADWTSFVLIIGGCAVGYAVALLRRLPLRLAAVLGSALAIVVSGWLILRFGRVWVLPAEPVSGVVMASAFLGVADFAEERHRRRKIQNAFGQYVAPEIVRQIIDNPDRVKLGGELKMITVLFADIRGFTGISEALQTQPEKLTLLINNVLSTLSEIVTRHGGTIDKYIGDCVMAFWNAPLDDPNHASRAVCAALEMIQSVALMNETAPIFDASGTNLEVAIGVGINSGECVVGNMGSDLRFDYTVIGDPVNVASRLESLSREYGVSMLIGDETATVTRSRFDYVEVDRIRVRGKQTEQLVYTIKHLQSAPHRATQPDGGTNG